MTLRSQLNDLASSFADAIVDVIRASSLEELMSHTDAGARRGPGRPPGSSNKNNTRPARAFKSDRLPRRSAEEIAKAPESLLKLDKNNDGQLGPREYGPRPPEGHPPQEGGKDDHKPGRYSGCPAKYLHLPPWPGTPLPAKEVLKIRK